MLGPLRELDPDAYAEYAATFLDPAAVHAGCEDYRASATIDFEHDRADRERGTRVACPTQLVWGKESVVGRLFDVPSVWEPYVSGPVDARPLDGGHFLPDELADEVADVLLGLRPRG